MEINVCHSSSALCVCVAIAHVRGGERERGGGVSMDRVVSIWLASCANGHKELFVLQQAGGESSPLRLRDSGELKDSLSV